MRSLATWLVFVGSFYVLMSVDGGANVAWSVTGLTLVAGGCLLGCERKGAVR